MLTKANSNDRAKRLNVAFIELQNQVRQVAVNHCDKRDVYAVHFIMQQFHALERMQRAIERYTIET